MRLLKARPLPEALGTALYALGNITEDWGAVYREVAERASRHLPREPLGVLLKEAPRAMAVAALEMAEEVLERGEAAPGEWDLEKALEALAELEMERAKTLLALLRGEEGAAVEEVRRFLTLHELGG